MIYLITYDLNREGQDYQELYDSIESYREYIHPLDSTWFIHTDSSVNEVSGYLESLIDKNDYIFVCEVTENRFGWMKKSFWKWLKDYSD